MRTIEGEGDMLARAAANCAGAYRTWAERLGKPARLWDDLSCGDLGLPVALPPNNATLLRPSTPETFEAVLERASAFFAGKPGGAFELWSMWPIPDFSAAGYEVYSCPCMIREAGGEPNPPPAELEILDAIDASTLLEAEQLVNDVFEGHAEPGAIFQPRLIDDRFRVWLGTVDGRPVSSASAYVGEGFVGVYAVVTATDARGHGYGEALTWAATMYRPDLPATLQASRMGQPVYERMGYRAAAAFTVWECPRA